MLKNKILIVDDIDINREILVEILRDEYDIVQGKDGFEAVELAITHHEELVLILLDIMMPEMDGFKSLEILKSNPFTRQIPVMIVTAANTSLDEITGLKYGAVDFIVKPFNPDVVKMRVASQVKIKRYEDQMEDLVNQQVSKLQYVQEMIIDFLATVVEYRDIESGHHVKRTRFLVKNLIQKLHEDGKIEPDCKSEDRMYIIKAVALHDVGKIAIPDNILIKPGKLTYEEFETMKAHTWLGAEIAENLKEAQSPEYVKYIKEICLYHHEKWDGTGYPKGLKGHDIPYSARLMAIVDVYDALMSERPYKKAFTHDESIQIIEESIGTHFDPVIAETFIRHNETFNEVFKKYAD